MRILRNPNLFCVRSSCIWLGIAGLIALLNLGSASLGSSVWPQSDLPVASSLLSADYSIWDSVLVADIHTRLGVDLQKTQLLQYRNGPVVDSSSQSLLPGESVTGPLQDQAILSDHTADQAPIVVEILIEPIVPVVTETQLGEPGVSGGLPLPVVPTPISGDDSAVLRDVLKGVHNDLEEVRDVLRNKPWRAIQEEMIEMDNGLDEFRE